MIISSFIGGLVGGFFASILTAHRYKQKIRHIHEQLESKLLTFSFKSSNESSSTTIKSHVIACAETGEGVRIEIPISDIMTLQKRMNAPSWQ